MKLTETQPWRDDLIWCPSQCYYYFYVVKGNKKHHFVIYLRWRHQDPWRGYVSRQSKSYGSQEYFEHELPSIKNFTSESSLDELKAQAIKDSMEIVKKLLS